MKEHSEVPGIKTWIFWGAIHQPTTMSFRFLIGRKEGEKSRKGEGTFFYEMKSYANLASSSDFFFLKLAIQNNKASLSVGISFECTSIVMFFEV